MADHVGPIASVVSIRTPFYFIEGGPYVALPALVSGAGLVGLFFSRKMVSKGVGIWPLTRVFRFDRREGNYTTLLMATGLTFGSAVIPTLIAQR